MRKTGTCLSEIVKVEYFAVKEYINFLLLLTILPEVRLLMIQLRGRTNDFKHINIELPEASAVLVDYFGNRIKLNVIYVPLRFNLLMI